MAPCSSPGTASALPALARGTHSPPWIFEWLRGLWKSGFQNNRDRFRESETTRRIAITTRQLCTVGQNLYTCLVRLPQQLAVMGINMIGRPHRFDTRMIHHKKQHRAIT